MTNEYGDDPVVSSVPGASRGAAIGALIANAIGLCLCFVFTIPGIILATIAIAQADNNPKGSRICTRAAWILFALAILGWPVLWFVVFAPESTARSLNEFFNFFNTLLS
ncbi:hypothetical protein [Nocardiopsis tropica]|uniref:DUF4190 domain-containing protein n=1 Tax=Nocardiopsis tropica TaxID=109330 RepID=A0ABV2A1Q0_9ACTN